MSYIRVIPRDLFNESSLLKCIGRIYINLENAVRADEAELRDETELGEPFNVIQSPDDGSIYLANVSLYVRRRKVHLSRPLNSRDPWPLWAIIPLDVAGDEGEEIEVFTDEGEFSPDFLDYIRGEGRFAE